MAQKKHTVSGIGRREFLAGVSAAGSAFVLGDVRAAAETSSGSKTARGPLLPTIRLGEHRVTRLIAGSNPVSGYSYMGPFMDQHMREYFTDEQTAEFLWDCERAGISTHQFSDPEKMAGVIRELRGRGSKMKFFCLHADMDGKPSIDQVVRDTQPIAVVHHGGVTDRLFREGKSGQVKDYLKRVHDAGVLAGVSAHNPDCIKRVADEGWEVDFFMTCFYYLTRPKDELEKASVVTLQIGYPFFASDPDVMTSVVRQVDQPCLGFKILAAGRKCSHKEQVREAFKYAFERIKPSDGVIVGMYPRFEDQIGENAGYVREFGKA